VNRHDQAKEATLSYLVEKLVTELKRIRDRNRIDLQLDSEIMKLFFNERLSSASLSEDQLSQMEDTLRDKYRSMGDWTSSYPFMVNSFLKDYFTLGAAVERANMDVESKENRISVLEQQLQKQLQEIIYINSSNGDLLRTYSRLIEALSSVERHGLSDSEISKLLK
jgi:predicted ribosome quality control (RQC) complex YloA/Tae2 family protein